MTPQHANGIVRSAEAVLKMEAMVSILPSRERHVRELLRIDGDGDRAAVWQAVALRPFVVNRLPAVGGHGGSRRGAAVQVDNIKLNGGGTGEEYLLRRLKKHDREHGTPAGVIVGPVGHVPVPAAEFPAVVRVAVYGHVTGCHGTYPVTFELRAADGDVVWQWRPPTPLRMADPLALTQLVFQELRVSVPAAGLYDLVLQAGQDDIGRQPLVIGPADMVRRHQA